MPKFWKPGTKLKHSPQKNRKKNSQYSAHKKRKARLDSDGMIEETPKKKKIDATGKKLSGKLLQMKVRAELSIYI